MLVKMWRKGDPHTLLVGMWIDAPTVENSVEVPPKTKNRTSTWFSNLTSGYIFKEHRNTKLKRHMHPSVHDIVYNSQDMEAT